jgi:hypothetical protein
LFLLDKATGLFYSFWWAVTIVQAEHSDGATVNTAPIIDHFVICHRGMTLRAK